MSYADSVRNLSLIQTYGWHGVHIESERLEPLPCYQRILSWISSPPTSQEVKDLATRSVRTINLTHGTLSPESPAADVHTYFREKSLFAAWNRSESEQITYSGHVQASSTPFGSEVNCYYETEELTPLVVSPQDSSTSFTEWADQSSIATVLNTQGAIVFRGFDLNKDNFSAAFQAATGKEPAPYPGDTPREEVAKDVYKSTAVADGHKIPLHQEASSAPRASMPDHIAFFCVTPPEKGTGQTLLGDVSKVTEELKTSDIWPLLDGGSLTYISRYLPTGSLRTRWIRKLNPSHATIEQRFGTEDPQRYCSQHGYAGRWDGDWFVLSHKNVPATIEVNGATLFCNQVHLDKPSPTLFGGWVSYLLARLFLYHTARSMQFDVEHSDGGEISSSVADRILTIMKKHEIVRDWEKSDLLLVNNKTMFHGKNPHQGPREIIVAMA